MLDPAARALVTSGTCGHVVTIDPDGSPQVTLAWFDLEGDQLVFATLAHQRKLANLQRDPRIVVSFAADRPDAHGLLPYLVVHGRAEVTEGGAPALLQRLAHRYLGPEVRFPPMADPPAGFITRITIERVGGHGPWA